MQLTIDPKMTAAMEVSDGAGHSCGSGQAANCDGGDDGWCERGNLAAAACPLTLTSVVGNMEPTMDNT